MFRSQGYANGDKLLPGALGAGRPHHVRLQLRLQPRLHDKQVSRRGIQRFILQFKLKVTCYPEIVFFLV